MNPTDLMAAAFRKRAQELSQPWVQREGFTQLLAQLPPAVRAQYEAMQPEDKARVADRWGRERATPERMLATIQQEIANISGAVPTAQAAPATAASPAAFAPGPGNTPPEQWPGGAAQQPAVSQPAVNPAAAGQPVAGPDMRTWADRSQAQVPQAQAADRRLALAERNQQWTSYWDKPGTQTDYAPTMGQRYALDPKQWPAEYRDQRSGQTAEMGRAWDRAQADVVRGQSHERPGFRAGTIGTIGTPGTPGRINMHGADVAAAANRFLFKQRAEGQGSPGVSADELGQQVYEQDPAGWHAREAERARLGEEYAKQTPYRYVESQGRSLDPEMVAPSDIEGRPHAVIQATNAEQEARLREMRTANQEGRVPGMQAQYEYGIQASLSPEQAARAQGWKAPTSVVGSPDAKRIAADRARSEAYAEQFRNAATPEAQQQMYADSLGGMAFHRREAEALSQPQSVLGEWTVPPAQRAEYRRKYFASLKPEQRAAMQQERSDKQLASLGQSWEAQRKAMAARKVNPNLRSKATNEENIAAFDAKMKQMYPAAASTPAAANTPAAASTAAGKAVATGQRLTQGVTPATGVALGGLAAAHPIAGAAAAGTLAYRNWKKQPPAAAATTRQPLVAVGIPTGGKQYQGGLPPGMPPPAVTAPPAPAQPKPAAAKPPGVQIPSKVYESDGYREVAKTTKPAGGRIT